MNSIAKQLSSNGFFINVAKFKPDYFVKHMALKWSNTITDKCAKYNKESFINLTIFYINYLRFQTT